MNESQLMFLDGHERRPVVVRRPPLALQQFVTGTQLFCPRKILFAIHEPLCVLNRVLAVLDRLAVDQGHAGAHQRRVVRGIDAARFEDVRDGFRLAALDVDEEVIRRILVERLPPAVEQVRAYQRQQKKHREPQPERHDLHGTRPAAPGDVRQAVTPCNTDAGTKAPHGRDEPATHEVQRAGDDDDPAEHDDEHRGIADGPVQERRDRSHRKASDENSRRRWRHRVVAEHAQRRRVAQLDQ
jgi:hypothetical protein